MAGYLLVHDGKPIFFLPGVPHEMRELLAERVLPRLALWAGKSIRTVQQRVYKIFGLPELDVNRRLNHLEKSDSRVRIGYYPVFPEVHLSLTVMAAEAEEAEEVFQRFSKEIEAIFSDTIYGLDDDTLEGVTGRLLAAKGLTLAVAESCSGGLVSHRITAVPGSSAYFTGGVVAYSNKLKEAFLGVDPAILKQHGAVSPACVRAMAEGIRARTGADLGLAITGIAGPTGGSDAKPVGTVFFGLATRAGIYDLACRFAGNRGQIQEMSAATALNLVRCLLLDRPIMADNNT